MSMTMEPIRLEKFEQLGEQDLIDAETLQQDLNQIDALSLNVESANNVIVEEPPHTSTPRMIMNKLSQFKVPFLTRTLSKSVEKLSTSSISSEESEIREQNLDSLTAKQKFQKATGKLLDRFQNMKSKQQTLFFKYAKNGVEGCRFKGCTCAGLTCSHLALSEVYGKRILFGKEVENFLIHQSVKCCAICGHPAQWHGKDRRRQSEEVVGEVNSCHVQSGSDESTNT